ncbi:MAG: ATPase [Oscillospiraceae bacterium]|nr:ATPase [Oscillospiraceae bacterium]
MEIYKIIDSLEELIEKSASVPLSGKCLVKKEDVLEIVRNLRLKLPDEIQEAARLTADKENVVKNAEIEAQRIIKDADDAFNELVDEHEIISAAYKKANVIITGAEQNAEDIKRGTYEYVQKLLETVESNLYGTLNTLNSNKREIQSFIEE